ncbi:MAG TPA: RDD family protein [Candidatus Limnocylindrales bacterium]|jgi:uncharacterized RDD family membrane protein YckC|nr:RDD family protein [Candidatus Limnocylindrales bacterium]
MNCPLCGNSYPCAHSHPQSSLLLEPAEQANGPADVTAELEIQEADWRGEVASRVQQHRSRRRSDDAVERSLDFDFPGATTGLAPRPNLAARRRQTMEMIQSVSFNSALDVAPEPQFENGEPEPVRMGAPKIIRFPRSAVTEIPEPQTSPEIEEALEVNDLESPRILMDAPPPQPPAEQLELLPNFDDIQLESVHNPLLAEIDALPRPAALGQRMMAGVIDAVVVVAAVMMFNMAFSQLAEAALQSRVALLSTVMVGAVVWTLYQYLFLVYGRRTPGMNLGGLELSTFDGKPLSVRQRQYRAMAGTLSVVSVGLGYLWALVDENQLGWHDRITQTLVKSAGEERVRQQLGW